MYKRQIKITFMTTFRETNSGSACCHFGQSPLSSWDLTGNPIEPHKVESEGSALLMRYFDGTVN